MNLALTDEQELLREAARGTLGRLSTIAAARDALDGGELPDLWPTAREAGWPGLLIGETNGGAGLGAFDAMLVLAECGRVLAGVALIGHLPATAVLDAAGAEGLEQLASGERRAAFLPARPPDDLHAQWTVDSRRGHARAALPTVSGDGDRLTVSGTVAWVPDAAGADVLVGAAQREDGELVAVGIDPAAAGVTIEPAHGYDATRALAHVTLEGAAAAALDAGDEQLRTAWYLAQALLAAESVGAIETALDVSVAYAKERYTFGRAIGSYQAVKHGLVEVLRLLENARSLLYYAGWAYADGPDEFALAASAARSAGGRGLDFAAREMIAVHGGIGATWEHDAPLFFRRAQLSRRLLAGTQDASDRVAQELLAAADARTAAIAG
jgi:alkylation response protein AidB-like acyl-CoA dehydrogenase